MMQTVPEPLDQVNEKLSATDSREINQAIEREFTARRQGHRFVSSRYPRGRPPA